MPDKDWKVEANRKWGKEAEWVIGKGQFALLAPCDVLTVTLWETLEEAEKQKRSIDLTACGGGCTWELHHIIDMEQLT